MAHAICFDTLAYSNKLKEAGIPSKQAEIQAELLAEIFEERIATKQDIDTLKNEMKVEFSKVDIKFAELKVEVIKWVVGISAAQAALIISILKFVH